MEFHFLSDRRASAAENMATDFLLLRRTPGPATVRFRHYGWHRPAFTFGYSQKIAEVRAQLPAELSSLDLTRRATGGGLVDHRNDWTYALIIPRGHILEEQPAPASYRVVHEALRAALQKQSVAAELETATAPVAKGKIAAGVCFDQAETSDVIHALTRHKIAGAAQKRTKEGLLLQGSISRAALPATGFAWEPFVENFADALGGALQLSPQRQAWPDLNGEELSALIDQYASTEWRELR